ncbi:MAG: DnaJ C-terminal domain-containing protein [Actinomycetota bacterium]|nr:DnaJ C-terminal domain-containing protein [Actinomycetota bacterium]
MEVDPAWLETDYYETLGVSPVAEPGEITRAYRRRARHLHPDASSDPAAADRFAELTAAYEVLSDPDRRVAYDQTRRQVDRGVRRRPGGGYTIRVDHVEGRETDPASAGSRTRRVRVRDRSGSSTRRIPPSRPGAAARAEVKLPFADAVRGTTAAVSVPGRGTVTVPVPPGVEDGQTLRVPVSPHSDPNGAGDDLVVTVHVEDDQHFSRRGDDLTLTVPITVTEAIRGTKVTVPTIENRPVTVRIPPGTPSGRTLRIPGRGVPTATRRGDLLITVQIHVPTDLDEGHNQLIDELARWEDPTGLRAHLEVNP